MNARTRRLLLVWGSLLLLLLLVRSLPNLTLPPRRIVALDSTSQDPLAYIMQRMQLLALLTTSLFAIFVLIFLPVLRTRQTLVALALTLLVLLTLAWVLVQIPTPEAPPPTPAALPQNEVEEIDEPLPTEIPVVEPTPLPTPPPWVSLLVSFVVVTSILAFAAVLAWRFWPRPAAESPLLELSREVEEALEALEQGEALRNVVVRCYVEMGRVLDETRGIKRAQAMTPREFEHELKRLGLPLEPVTGLTRLFERVRYGTEQPDTYDEQQATESLAAIVLACQEGA